MEWTQDLPAPLWALTGGILLVAVVHECGHALMALLLHVPVRLVTVGLGPIVWRHPLGHNAHFVLRAVPATMSIAVNWRWDEQGELRRPIHHDLLMAAGGPLANFLLTLLLLLLVWGLPVAQEVDHWLIATALISLISGVISLLPFPGLDGGHLLVVGMSAWGWQLTPAREKTVHRMGMSLITLASVLLILYLALVSA